jgi:hypothetical protein
VSTRVKIAVVVGIAVVAAALTVFIIRILGSGDEDRPPIVVRSGSVYVDGGESNSTNWKPWKQKGADKKQWQPDHGNGASARNFSVTIAYSNSASAPSTPCPALPLVGTKVTVEYTTDGGVKSQLVVNLDTQGSKKIPLVTAPADMTQNAGSGSTPDQIVYDPGAGIISNVTVADDTGAQQMCGFVKPAKAVITIKPNR